MSIVFTNHFKPKKKKKVKRKSEFNVKAKSRKVNPISDFDNHKPLHIQLFVFIPNEEKKHSSTHP